MSLCLKTPCVLCWTCPFQLLLLLVCNSFFTMSAACWWARKPRPKKKTLPLIPSAFSALRLLRTCGTSSESKLRPKTCRALCPNRETLEFQGHCRQKARAWTGLTGSPKLLVYSSVYQTRMSLQKGVLHPTCQRTLHPTSLKTKV